MHLATHINRGTRATCSEQPLSQFARCQARLMFVLARIGHDIAFKVCTLLSTNKCQLSQDTSPFASSLSQLRLTLGSTTADVM